MKRYKLQKDLPIFKVGDEFYLDSDNNLCLKNTSVIVYNNFVLEEFPNILTDWFEEIPENKRWRAEYNGGYYYIEDGGNVMDSDDYEDEEDDYRYDTDNYGRTKKELEVKREYNIARQVLIDDAKGGKWKKNGTNLYVYYDHDIDKWIPYEDIDNIQITGAIYFQDEEDAQKSLEEHKEQWDIVHKYEMGQNK